MADVFIAYRQENSHPNTHRLYERLSAKFGKKSIVLASGFHGSESLKEIMAYEIQRAKVVLVMIEPSWQDNHVVLRLHAPDDPLRVMLELALMQISTRIIPIRVDNTLIPDKVKLPYSLQDVAYRHALPLRSSDFDHDANLIVSEIRAQGVRPGGSCLRQLLMGVLVMMLVAFFGVLLMFAQSQMPPSAPSVIILNPSESPTFPANVIPITPTIDPNLNIIATPTIIPTLTIFQRASMPVARNADWAPVIEKFDGVEMVLVPAGCFDMGFDEQGRRWTGIGWIALEGGIADVCFDRPFWMDRYEVTNALYRSKGSYDGDNRPRDSVTWVDALAHCTERGADLPTEAQWEYAARGPDNLIYPWGNQLDFNRSANLRNSSGPSAVGSYAAGDSWVGAADMAGNVWEWTMTYAQDYPYDVANPNQVDTRYRILRGGAWAFDERFFRTTVRLQYAVDFYYSNIGFRCVRPMLESDLE